MIPNHYKTLGLDFKSTKIEIKKAYRKLALKFHPDRNKSPNAHQEFININEAYLILQDEESRAKYDKEYIEYFIKPNSNKQQSEKVKFEDEDLNRWTNTAKQQAESFAKMSFKNFTNLIYGAAKETGFQLGNSILAMLGAFLSVSGFFNLIFSLSAEGGSGNIVLSLIFIPIGIFLYSLANKNYDNHKN